MQELPDAVASAFSNGGLLQRAIPSFISRPGQNTLAVEIAKTVQNGGVLVAEAGTGIGKTYAYLVPILMSGQRAVISTANKALQDQLALRDLPLITSALNLPLRVQVLKGRSSYVCLHRLQSAGHHLPRLSPAATVQLTRVLEWSAITRTGDLSELPDFSEQTELARSVTSTTDNCVGGDCPKASQCYVSLARDKASLAEIVVINHHLFFSDLRARDIGVRELLPSVATVIFDEAHHLNDIGIQFLGHRFSSQLTEDICRDVNALAGVLSLGAADWRSWVNTVRRSTAKLRNLLLEVGGEKVLLWVESSQTPQYVERDAWAFHTGELRAAMMQIAQLLRHLAPTAPELAALGDRTEANISALDTLLGLTPSGHVKWLEPGPTWTLMCSPIHIRDAMHALLKEGVSTFSTKRSWIFTSATLGYENNLSFFTKSCGLDGARVLRVKSPFDFPNQASLYIPKDFPSPNSPLHSLEVAHLVAHAAGILVGRTLVLTTTLRAMREIGKSLHMHFSVGKDLRVLVQGDLPKAKILKLLAAAVAEDQRGVVVVATTSFWEGVDVPGDAVQLLVIDKIPFPSPDAPLILAREERITAQGKNAFRDLYLPVAALALKQGAGRLIRTEKDRGVLVICDARLLSQTYGEKILNELPMMNRIVDRDQWHTALQGLTKFSTTDPY